MSTTAIKAVLDGVSEEFGEGRVRDARQELEAIEKAARDMDRLRVGDFIYDIRDSEHVMKETPDGQGTWEHQDVRAWGDASQLMAAIARQEKSK